MEKSKRKKMIVVGSIILAIALLIGFPFAWNAGMFLPSGYKQAYGSIGEKAWGEVNYPFFYYEDYGISGSYSTKYVCSEDTGWYIPEQTDLIDYNRYFFDYNGNKNFYYNSLNIYKTADDSLVGSLIKKEKDGGYKCNQTYNFIFLDDNYVYYIAKTRIKRFHFAVYTDSGTFRREYLKYEFYRFNLDNGQNQKIEPRLYIEKINKYDESIKLMVLNSSDITKAIIDVEISK